MSPINYILHIDQYIQLWTQNFGPWIYVVLFAIIFSETGLVVFPFLPGDSLLFAVGATATLAGSNLNIFILCGLLSFAAVMGDWLNYQIGARAGPKIFHKENSLFFNKSYLLKAQDFYNRYGGRAIVLARFVPIVRTFVPFVAGVGKMHFAQFAKYNVLGGVSWICLFLMAGYYFGNLPIVQKNFHIVIFAVVIISILPIVIEFVRARFTAPPSEKN